MSVPIRNQSGDKLALRVQHTKNLEPLRYNPQLPLFWSLDFNVNPMCSVIGQRDRDRVYILDELALPDSTTWHTCEAFLELIGSWGRLSPHTTGIDVYGDATGNRVDTASFPDLVSGHIHGVFLALCGDGVTE